MQDLVEESEEIALYTKRWFLLVGLCIFTMLTQFLSSSFGTADKILSAYFDESLLVLDLAVETLYLGAIVVTPFFAYFCFRDRLGFRIMSIFGTICVLISALVIVFSVVFPIIFSFMLVSISLQGIAYLISVSMGTFFSVLWFPEKEVDIAIALNIIFETMGVLLGSNLPVIFLKAPPKNESASEHEINFSNWKTSTYYTLVTMYSAVTVILCILLVLFIIYAKDIPPKPPTYALLLKRKSQQTEELHYSFHDFVSQCKTLFKDIHFLMMNVALSTSYNAIGLMALSSSEVTSFTVSDSFHISPDVVSGLLVLAASLAAVLFSFIVAKCLKRFQIYLSLCIAGGFILFLGGISAWLSFQYKNPVVLFIAAILLGSGTRGVVISLFVIVTRHTYPISEPFVSIWVTGFASLHFILIALLQRLLSNTFSAKSIPITQTVIFFVSFVLSLLIKPKNKRENASESMMAETNERAPILAPNP